MLHCILVLHTKHGNYLLILNFVCLTASINVVKIIIRVLIDYKWCKFSNATNKHMVQSCSSTAAWQGIAIGDHEGLGFKKKLTAY